MGQCYSSTDGTEWRPHLRRSGLTLKQNQVYHLNHIECLPYQGRRSRYSTQSSFLGLGTRQSSTRPLVPSTCQNSVAGSTPVLHRDNSLADSDPVLNRDTSLTGSNPVLLRRHNRDSGTYRFSRQQSLCDLQPGTGPGDWRRHGAKRPFRSYLEYQAVRQSYLLAMSQENLVEDPAESTPSLSNGGFLLAFASAACDSFPLLDPPHMPCA